ncbi:MAG: hypothetical protein ACK4WH_16260, partial [Phycisphaerales bacterium]
MEAIWSDPPPASGPAGVAAGCPEGVACCGTADRRDRWGGRRADRSLEQALRRAGPGQGTRGNRRDSAR